MAMPFLRFSCNVYAKQCNTKICCNHYLSIQREKLLLFILYHIMLWWCCFPIFGFGRILYSISDICSSCMSVEDWGPFKCYFSFDYRWVTWFHFCYGISPNFQSDSRHFSTKYHLPIFSWTTNYLKNYQPKAQASLNSL